MQLYALVGKSGSGKSYKSHMVTGTYNIEYVIDDGLLIKGTKIIAGVSAKREKTKFGAVRRAIFKNDKHRLEVSQALSQQEPKKLLVIGTSEHMIQSILEALGLPSEYHVIYIEDIASPEEIELAHHTRRTLGKHVIPVPTFEVKKAFSGYFIDSIRHWARKNESRPPAQTTSMGAYDKLGAFGAGQGGADEQLHGTIGNAPVVAETTVVRPTFSYLGSYEIKDAAIKAIITESATEVDGIARVNGVQLKNEADGLHILITVTLNCKGSLTVAVNRMSERIRLNVEQMTGIYVLELNTIIKALLQ